MQPVFFLVVPALLSLLIGQEGRLLAPSSHNIHRTDPWWKVKQLLAALICRSPEDRSADRHGLALACPYGPHQNGFVLQIQADP